MTKIKPFDVAVMYVIALLASSISSYSAYGQDVPKPDVTKYVVKSRAPLDVVVVTSADGLLVREVVKQTGGSTENASVCVTSAGKSHGMCRSITPGR